MSFAIGEQVGPYQIMGQLGSGGMATVFKAYHAALDRYVAIKVLHPAFKQDPNFLSRFQREARIVAKLDHPHIVPVYDFNDVHGQSYLVMRFIAGETLKARLAAGDLTLTEVRRVIQPVADALAYAHEQGVLHRDVKPSNILLTPEGGVFLADFGLARIAQAGESTLSQDSLLGTPQYISPEQAQGQSDLDARTDIYSLGVVIYELLVGRVPYQADTPYAVIHDHIYAPLPLPRSIKPDFPEALERVLLKALTKDRADRYASVGELWSAFDGAVTDLSSSLPASPAPRPVARAAPPTPIDSLATRAVPAESPKPKSRRWLALGAVALIAILVIALIVARAPGPAGPGLDRPGGVPPGFDRPGGANPDGAALIAALREDFTRANDLAKQGQADQARGAFVAVADRAEQQLGDNRAAPEQQVQLRVIAGESWLAANEPVKAQAQFAVLAQQSPGNAEIQTALAAASLLQNDLDAADAALSRALRANTDYAAAHALKACVLLKRTDRVAALREFNQSGGLELNAPIAPWVRLALAELDCRADRFR